MTKEELEKNYYANRPIEPYSSDDSPNSWANIAHYAEENLERAFKRIVELECECRRCVHTDCPCVLSDYGKDRNGICDHFEDVFDENAELKEELNYAETHYLFHSDCPTQKELAGIKLKVEALSEDVPWNELKDKSEVVGKLTKAKDLIELLLSDNRIMKAQFESEEQANIWFEHIHQAEQFISEVEK